MGFALYATIAWRPFLVDQPEGDMDKKLFLILRLNFTRPSNAANKRPATEKTSTDTGH